MGSRKAWIALALCALLVASAPAAPPANKPQSLRDCINAAPGPGGIARCEKLEQTRLQQRIEDLVRAIRTRLDNRQRLAFERSQQAWQTFFDSELAMLDISGAARRDGLGKSLKIGAATALYETREQQLRAHLHNLSQGAADELPSE